MLGEFQTQETPLLNRGGNVYTYIVEENKGQVGSGGEKTISVYIR